MKLLTAAINRIPEFQQLLTAMEAGRCPVALSGVAAVHRAHIAAGVGVYAFTYTATAIVKPIMMTLCAAVAGVMAVNQNKNTKL